jgi:hypothetical protein
VALLVLPLVVLLLLWLLWFRYIHHWDAAVVVAVIFGFAALSVALPLPWLAWVPVRDARKARRSAPHGRPADQRKPVDLGVHEVIGGGPMPDYIRRPHDERLRAVLDPAVPASRLVVVRGGSSTGKTRAAYEAVQDRLGDWQLDYPLDLDALKERLDAGVPTRTVLWLGQLPQYADDGGRPTVPGRLADLLEGTGHVLITTMWFEHWNTYIAAADAGSGADPAGTVGRLLKRLPDLTDIDPGRIDPARGGVINVPDKFTDAEVTTAMATAARTGNPVLEEAAEAAAGDKQKGQVTQYLAGVPDLLDRYEGHGDDYPRPYGQAVITAAMDATRLGHASPLPAALVQEAAVGYLSDAERTEDMAIWRDTALAWATEKLKGAVQALRCVPFASGTGVAGRRVADYLDQEGRRTRQDQIGPASLWDALIAHAATAGDMVRLGQAAQARGLYRHAADLWTRAASLGSANGARLLIGHLRAVSAADTTRAAQWAVGRVSLGDPSAVGELLYELRGAGAWDAVHALLARDPARQASLDKPWPVAYLLWELHQAGAGDAVHALATRAADQVSLDDPWGVPSLLEYLHAAGAGEAAQTLADQAVGQVSPDDPQAVSGLLGALRTAGAGDAVHALLARDPVGQASLDDLWAVSSLLWVLHQAGAGDAVHALADQAADQASLDDPSAIAALLSALHRAGAGDAVQALADRAASQVSLDDPQAVAGLLNTLSWVGAGDAVHALAARAPSQASLDDPKAITYLLWALARVPGTGGAAQALATRAADQVSLDDAEAVGELLRTLHAWAGGAAQALLAREPARHVSLENPQAVARLLRALREAGAEDAVQALLARDPAGQVSLNPPWAIGELLQALREAGAEDGTQALLARDPVGQVSLDDPRAIGELLRALREAGDRDAVDALATRAANAGMFDLFLEVHPEQAPSYPFGREPDGTPSKSRRWQEPDTALGAEPKR